jgi:hypothetical protein
VRSLTGGQQLEYREDRYAEERLAVQRPGPCRPLSMAPKLADVVRPTPYEGHCRCYGLFNPQAGTLFYSLAGVRKGVIYLAQGVLRRLL